MSVINHNPQDKSIMLGHIDRCPRCDRSFKNFCAWCVFDHATDEAIAKWPQVEYGKGTDVLAMKRINAVYGLDPDAWDVK